jgi:hydroxymethylpyrimidine/phosphomethylpyrimidine kinase
LKGGHLGGPECADLLVESGLPAWFRSPRIDTPASHGTGCTLSAAIAANLALGRDLHESVGRAKDYLGQTLESCLSWHEFSMLNQGTVGFPERPAMM